MLGLILEGGGAKGAFQCGAIQALYDNGYKFDGVAGTSIGAINGAMIVQDGNCDTCMKFWQSVSVSHFTDFDDNEVERLLNKDRSVDTIAYWLKQVAKVVSNGGISTDKIYTLLKEYISEEKVRRSGRDFAVVTYSLTDRMPVELYLRDIPEGELHDYIFASAHYPAFKLNRVNGKIYVDGGIYDNMPVMLLAHIHYDKVIAIRTMSKMPHRLPKDSNIQVDFICPSEPLGKMLAVSRKTIDYNIKMGYFDAMRYIKGYYGKNYYIDCDLSVFFDRFNRLLEESIQAELIETKNEASKEDRIRWFKNSLTELYTKLVFSEETAALLFLEEFAKFYGVEKFQVYTVDEFFSEIRRKYESHNIKEKQKTSVFAREMTKKMNLFQILMKRENGG